MSEKPDQTSQPKTPVLDAPYLLRLVQGAIVKTFAKEMDPEMLAAIGAAASAYAQLYQIVELEEKCKLLEQQVLMTKSTLSA